MKNLISQHDREKFSQKINVSAAVFRIDVGQTKILNKNPDVDRSAWRNKLHLDFSPPKIIVV